MEAADHWDIYQNANQLRFNKDLLQCSLCDTLLTSPIFFNATSGNICKSCKTDQNIHGERNEPLEIALQKALIPCKFACDALVPRDFLVKHQWSCRRAPIKCPKCKTNGFKTIEEVILHCKDAHFMVEVTSDKEYPVLNLGMYNSDEDGIKMSLFHVRRENNQFIAKVVQAQWNELHITVCCPIGVKANYQLTLIIEESGQEISTKCNIFNCWNVLNATDEYQGTKIYLTEQFQLSACKTKSIDIQLEFNKKKVLMPLKDAENFRKDIECPVCFQFLLGDIMKCPNGHNICNSCKTLINTCPICRKTMNNTHDIRMENILPQFAMNCHNACNGCLVVSDLKSLKEHEESCPYQQYECGMDGCNYESTQMGLIQHYIQKEPMYVLGSERTHDLDEKLLVNIVYGDNIFCLKAELNEGKYQWLVDIVNSTAIQTQFVYDIDLYQPNNTKFLTLTNTCGSYLYHSLEMMQKICDSDNCFSFKCYIRKINMDL